MFLFLLLLSIFFFADSRHKFCNELHLPSAEEQVGGGEDFFNFFVIFFILFLYFIYRGGLSSVFIADVEDVPDNPSSQHSLRFD